MTTTFADVIPIKQLTTHQYAVDFEEEWCIGIVPNGGYVTSAFQIAARTHMRLTHTSRGQPDVVNLHLEFVKPTSVGQALFTVREVKLGTRVSNLHITLSQDETDEVEGYLTMTNISSEEGVSFDTGYAALPPPVPVSLPQLAQGQDANYIFRSSDPFADFRRASKNIAIHTVRPERRPGSFPKAMIDQWVRFTPVSPAFAAGGGRWTNDALGFVVDMFPQIVETYIHPLAEEAAIGRVDRSPDEVRSSIQTTRPRVGFWYPTLNLNLDVKKQLPTEGVEWLFVRVQAKRIKNGRFDLRVEVWDEHRDLVATSTHASLAVDYRRNTGRGKKKKQQSKI